MRKKIISFLFLFLSVVAYAQNDTAKFECNGYVSNSASAMYIGLINDWYLDNSLHNRVNMFWHPKKNLTASLQFRNRLLAGQSVAFSAGSIENYNGLVSGSYNFFEDKNYLLNTMVDRLYVEYVKDKFEVTVGRHRINWSQSFVWNPNDIFNNYSFFDFDYPERQGSDAISARYYTGSLSMIECAVKLDSAGKTTAGMLYRFNKYNFDIQFLGGIIAENDIVFGTGFTGSIKGITSRGEMSYFQPAKNTFDTNGILVFSLSLERSFKHSIFVQVEMLYNRMKKENVPASINDLFFSSVSAKQLSLTRFTYFAQISKPLTPLLNGTFSAMYYPALKAVFMGPSIDLSVKDNLSLGVFVQSFIGKFGQTKASNFSAGFLRGKWNF